ncbi:MAG: hypothetical protein AMK73_05625, partial [Planctomycetes bacterium SM23_32]
MNNLLLGLLVAMCMAAPASAARRAGESRLALLADPGGRQEAETARDCLERMQRMLSAVGMDYTVLTQDQVLAGALDGYGVVVIPYAPNLSGGARATVKSFCSDGGKVMCFYATYGLEGQLGLSGTTYVPAAERRLFRRVRFRQGALNGLPVAFDQTSWNISSPISAPGTLVIADWLNAEGEESGYAAATISDSGFFFSHILIPEGPADEAAAGTMIKASAAYLAQHVTPRQDIAIVYGTLSERAGHSDARQVGRMVREMEQILDAAGLGHAVLTDQDVERGALEGRRVAIFPLNFEVSEAEAAQVRRFVEQGGRVIGCFSLGARLLPLVGVSESQFRAGGPDSPFQEVRFNSAAPERFPDSFGQRSANTMEVAPAADGKVIAWHDAGGVDTGVPAVILSPTGMFFSYILWAGDVSRTSDFMLAAICQLAGDDFYADAAGHAAARLWEFRRYRSRAEMEAACGAVPPAAEALAEATRLEGHARVFSETGQHDDAYRTLRQARAAAELAFIRSLPSRGGVEFRGAWLHSPSAPNDDWDALFAGMRRSHLNALLVNVCSGSYAHYESDVLPLSRLVREHGPQMEKMLAAAKRQGIEVHLWRVNFDLFWPDQAVRDRYVAENRVCRDPEGNVVGGDHSGTLCPSHPANRQLEVDAMMEMARKFHPDGIHFDYIRYPNSESCYCSGCRERFEALIGRRVAQWPQDVLAGGALREQYQDFRRDQITQVVREVSRRARAETPDVKVSAAVFSHYEASARDGVAQDWVKWVREGYLDFVCPMDYTTDADDLAGTVAAQRDLVAGRIPLCVGVGAWRASAAWHTADLVDTARANGADGLVFFEYRGQVVGDFIPALLEGPFADDASTPWA